MSNGVVTSTFAERLRDAELRLAIRVVNSGPCPEIIAAVPAVLHGNRNVAIASVTSTIILAANIAWKAKASAPIVYEGARNVRKAAKLMSVGSMALAYCEHGSEAEKMPSFKRWKITGEICDQFEKYEPHKAIILAAKIFGGLRRGNI